MPTVGDLDFCKKKFTEDDVESSFVYMLSKLSELWSDVEFSKLKDACIWDKRLSHELKHSLESANTLKTMFKLLSNTHFCTWLEIRILRSMANVAGVPKAIEIIDTFKSCVYSKKCSEVAKHLKRDYINPDHVESVTIKVNKDAECLVVADLIEYCHNLESILKQPTLSAIVNTKTGCLEVCLVIPKYWHLHVYEVIKSRFIKLRPFNIQYLQIGTLPKVYTADLTKMTETNLLLMKISSRSNSEFSNIHMYIPAYLCMYVYVRTYVHNCSYVYVISRVLCALGNTHIYIYVHIFIV